jgi:hypothetical protein
MITLRYQAPKTSAKPGFSNRSNPGYTPDTSTRFFNLTIYLALKETA